MFQISLLKFSFICHSRHHKHLLVNTIRSSRPELFCKKGVLKNFAKFTGKHQCQSLFFTKVEVLRPATRLWHSYFSVNFAKFLKTPFLTEHLRWLLQKN